MFKSYFNKENSMKLKYLCKSIEDGDWIESKDQTNDGIRLIQTGNIGNGYFKDKKDNYHFISEETYKRLNCKQVKPLDILVSRLPDPVGRMCIVPANIEKSITAVDCTIIKLEDNINKEYFIKNTLSDYYLNQIESELSGTTRKRISRKKLEEIFIPVPPIHLQNQFAKIVQLIDKQKFNYVHKIKLLKKIIKFFRGQII